MLRPFDRPKEDWQEPWFVGKDIAEALGYKNVNQAMADQVEDEDKQTMTIELTSVQATPARKGRKTQDMVMINESGLYGLIFGSSLPSAKEFKRWVTKEVLPSIRKTGGYINGATEALTAVVMENTRQTILNVLRIHDSKTTFGRSYGGIYDHPKTKHLSPELINAIIDDPSAVAAAAGFDLNGRFKGLMCSA